MEQKILEVKITPQPMDRKIFVEIKLPNGDCYFIREEDGWWRVYDKENECLYDKGCTYEAAYKFTQYIIEREVFILKGSL